MTRDGRAGCGRVESLDSDRCGTQVNRRGVRGPDTEPEGRGDHRQEHVVGFEFAVSDGFQMKVVPPVLGVDNAFGQPGGARRRVDQEYVVGPDGRQAAQTVRPGSGVDCEVVPDGDDGKPRIGIGGRLPSRREPVGIAGHESRPRRAEDRRHLAHAGARSEPNRDRTAAFDGNQQHMNGRRVLVPDRHAVTRCDAQREQ